MNKVTISDTVPTDQNGYIHLECPTCHENFMLSAEALNDENITEIWCPGCGLIHDNYYPQEVQDHLHKKLDDYVTEQLNEVFTDIAKTISSKNIKFKQSKKLKLNNPNNLQPYYGNLVEKNYSCCNVTAYIEPNRNLAGGYCPLCGGMIDGN
ncbi:MULTISPECIES: hypothetical protein [Aerococcus]|uniref:TFIIB-type zinc ribbon-containing protein n=1 Tax=Aerococcus urinae TaxID=1376 RepID=A0A329P3Z4_9LACT|nr:MULTISPECIES: hypothetical protein [Aerococcus]MDK6729050.1 hypothetical protein [Aerococcus urinae]RAV81453.1 hypothetical protein DBT54_00855 [Aerococcus loyolae]